MSRANLFVFEFRLPGIAASICALLVLAGCQSSGSVADETKRWQVLFDGTDLNQWRGLNRADIPQGHWLIDGDVLHKVSGQAAPVVAGNAPGYGGDIRSAQTYTNFELCFDFRFSPGANSGVKYNVSAELSAAHGHRSAAIGFEYQILDDARHPDAKLGRAGNRTVASLYDLYSADQNRKAVLPGIWYEGCVLADGSKISHSLDDEVVLSYDVASADFTRQLAQSKFAPIEGFAKRRAGYIVLQDHYDEVWYRNIRIRRLH